MNVSYHINLDWDLSNLPDESILNILSYLSVEDLSVRVSLVCKQLNQLASDNVLWKNITMKKFGVQQDCAKWKMTYYKLKLEHAKIKEAAESQLAYLQNTMTYFT